MEVDGFSSAVYSPSTSDSPLADRKCNHYYSGSRWDTVLQYSPAFWHFLLEKCPWNTESPLLDDNKLLSFFFSSVRKAFLAVLSWQLVPMGGQRAYLAGPWGDSFFCFPLSDSRAVSQASALHPLQLHTKHIQVSFLTCLAVGVVLRRVI